MFTDHGTFIIGFSVSKKHLAVAPEKVTIAHVEDDIVKAGYDYTEQLISLFCESAYAQWKDLVWWKAAIDDQNEK